MTRDAKIAAAKKALAKTERAQGVYRDALTESDRLCLQLYEQLHAEEGIGQNELARELGLNPATFRSRLMRAKSEGVT